MKKVMGLLTMCLVCAGCQFPLAQTTPVQTMVLPQEMSLPNDEDAEKVWIPAQTQRVWVNAHIDKNGDMIAGHYKYLVVTPGCWVLKGDES